MFELANADLDRRLRLQGWRFAHGRLASVHRWIVGDGAGGWYFGDAGNSSARMSFAEAAVACGALWQRPKPPTPREVAKEDRREAWWHAWSMLRGLHSVRLRWLSARARRRARRYIIDETLHWFPPSEIPASWHVERWSKRRARDWHIGLLERAGFLLGVNTNDDVRKGNVTVHYGIGEAYRHKRVF